MSALPIYQQDRRDDLADDLPEPSRWDVFLAHFWWIAAALVFGTIGYLAVMLP
ncbi:hypothetical protein [Rhodococcus artemisiae]|uniref:Uncharacterized protein n=1 Tax=Rhodococcus artemisiae TaxID=714159 RepID=A0ABU7LBP4_9NOCA|nr:hypothetical protein [Rhodococcus artemisiae]MEE2058939.1 hypothetical protein [Rhodococcus artemisiae]